MISYLGMILASVVGLNSTVMAQGSSSCVPAITGAVGGSVGCEVSTLTQDYLNSDPIAVNMGSGFFNNTDWSFLNKTEKVDVDDDDLNTGSQENLLGAGSSAFNEYLLVYKDGKFTTLVGYLLDSAPTSVTWSNPFIQAQFPGIPGGFKDVSHISVYGRNHQAPMTASAPALGLLIAGLALARRRLR